MKDAAPELNVSSSEAEEEREENKPEGEQDPDFNQVEIKTPTRFLGFLRRPRESARRDSPPPPLAAGRRNQRRPKSPRWRPYPRHRCGFGEVGCRR